MTERVRSMVAAGILGLSVWIAYGPALRNDFLFQDELALMGLARGVHEDGGWSRLLSVRLGGAHYYRPASLASLEILRRGLGDRPWAFHLLALALLVACGLLVCALIRRSGAGFLPALLGSAAFVLCAPQHWPAAHIAHMEKLRATAWLLMATWAVLRYGRSGRIGWAVAAAAGYAASLLEYPFGAGWVAMLTLAAWWPARSPRRAAGAGALAAVVCAGWVYTEVYAGGGGGLASYPMSASALPGGMSATALRNPPAMVLGCLAPWPSTGVVDPNDGRIQWARLITGAAGLKMAVVGGFLSLAGWRLFRGTAAERGALAWMAAAAMPFLARRVVHADALALFAAGLMGFLALQCGRAWRASRAAGRAALAAALVAAGVFWTAHHRAWVARFGEAGVLVRSVVESLRAIPQAPGRTASAVIEGLPWSLGQDPDRVIILEGMRSVELALLALDGRRDLRVVEGGVPRGRIPPDHWYFAVRDGRCRLVRSPWVQHLPGER